MVSARRSSNTGASKRGARRIGASPAPAASGFANHCAELLSPLGAVRVGRMFGGLGIYVDDLFIAIVADNCLYLKTDGETRDRFLAAGCRQFAFDAVGKTMTTSYWTVPDDAMEAPPAMAPWARLAIAAALRARASKAPKAARSGNAGRTHRPE